MPSLPPDSLTSSVIMIIESEYKNPTKDSQTEIILGQSKSHLFESCITQDSFSEDKSDVICGLDATFQVKNDFEVKHVTALPSSQYDPVNLESEIDNSNILEATPQDELPPNHTCSDILLSSKKH